jgi:hypothetical protein
MNGLSFVIGAQIGQLNYKIFSPSSLQTFQRNNVKGARGPARLSPRTRIRNDIWCGLKDEMYTNILVVVILYYFATSKSQLRISEWSINFIIAIKTKINNPIPYKFTTSSRNGLRKFFRRNYFFNLTSEVDFLFSLYSCSWNLAKDIVFSKSRKG